MTPGSIGFAVLKLEGDDGFAPLILAIAEDIARVTAASEEHRPIVCTEGIDIDVEKANGGLDLPLRGFRRHSRSIARADQRSPTILRTHTPRQGGPARREPAARFRNLAAPQRCIGPHVPWQDVDVFSLTPAPHGSKVWGTAARLA
jgi:hypothetical protein